MVRANFNITDSEGAISTLYPPLQWNECTSHRKMLTDVREWLHSHHPTWERAMVYLAHNTGGASFCESFQIYRRQEL